MSVASTDVEYELISINNAIEFAKSSIDLNDYKTRTRHYNWWVGYFFSDNDDTIFTYAGDDCFQPHIPRDLTSYFNKNMIRGLEEYMNLYGYTVDIWSECNFVEIEESDPYMYRILLTKGDGYDLCCYLSSLMLNFSNGSNKPLDRHFIQEINQIVGEYLDY